MWVASQLVERDDIGVVSGEPDEKCAGSAAVLTRRCGRQGGAEGIDGGVEDRDQGVRERGQTRGDHDVVTGMGRTSCMAARAYCW